MKGSLTCLGIVKGEPSEDINEADVGALEDVKGEDIEEGYEDGNDVIDSFVEDEE